MQFIRVDVLKKDYVNYHSINQQNIFFKDLFLLDTIDKTCNSCKVTFKSCRIKKKHMFLFHYRQQVGGRRSNTLPLSVLKRGPITYFSINFDQHKKFYDFFNGSAVDVFLDLVHRSFKPDNKENKFQGYAEIVNQQRVEGTTLEDNWVWLTNTFVSRHFNDFVKGEIRDEITKLIIANGLTGSSWYFKRFQRLTEIVTSQADSAKILSN